MWVYRLSSAVPWCQHSNNAVAFGKCVIFLLPWKVVINPWAPGSASPCSGFHGSLPLGKLKFCKLEFLFYSREIKIFIHDDIFREVSGIFFFPWKPRNLDFKNRSIFWINHHLLLFLSYVLLKLQCVDRYFKNTFFPPILVILFKISKFLTYFSVNFNGRLTRWK